MSKDKKMRVTIGVFDEDGEFHNEIAGEMSHREIKRIMTEILEEDGLPVLEVHGKHEKPNPAESAQRVLEDLKGIDKTVADIMRDHGLPLPRYGMPRGRLPLNVRWKIGAVEFSAMGDAAAVCDMEERFLKTLPDLNKTIGESNATTMKSFAEQVMEMLKNA